MARIQGVDLPRDKRIEIGLTYIYGSGARAPTTSSARPGSTPDTRVKDLTEAQEATLRDVIDQNYVTEGDPPP